MTYYDRSPVDLAWFEIISGARGSDWVEGLKVLFGDMDHFEIRRPQQLHRIVLGTCTIDLQEALRGFDIEEINARDEEGKTAIAWAAISGNVNAVLALLKAGADPNIPDYAHDTALMFAVYSKEPHIVDVLIAAGARFTKNDRQDTALHKAAFRQDNVQYLEPFVRGLRVNVDCKSDCDESPLCLATLQDHPNTVKFLIEHGADPNAIDEEGKTPLLDSIKYKSHKVLRVLLECPQVNLAFVQETYNTVLHNLADWGEPEAVGIFFETGADLSQLDIDAKNGLGMTALETAHARLNAPPGFAASFLALLLRIRVPRGGIIGSASSSVTAEYVDCMDWPMEGREALINF
jgi:ankyrin repeat protein